MKNKTVIVNNDPQPWSDNYTYICKDINEYRALRNEEKCGPLTNFIFTIFVILLMSLFIIKLVRITFR